MRFSRRHLLCLFLVDRTFDFGSGFFRTPRVEDTGLSETVAPRRVVYSAKEMTRRKMKKMQCAQKRYEVCAECHIGLAAGYRGDERELSMLKNSMCKLITLIFSQNESAGMLLRTAQRAALCVLLQKETWAARK